MGFPELAELPFQSLHAIAGWCGVLLAGLGRGAVVTGRWRGQA
jgi:hypothetical protein